MKLLGLPMVQKFLKNRINKHVKGQDESGRKKAKTIVWGEVCDELGKKVTARFETGDGYDVTAVGAIAAVCALMSNSIASGFKTPSQLMGTSVLNELPGFTGIEII